MLDKQNPKFRGIKTTQIPKYETKAKTVINRYGQKSLSLPRIDDKKRWAGFAGNTGISRKLVQLIPKCNIFCEPLAGTAKVAQELEKKRIRIHMTTILNDKSKFIAKWLRKEFPMLTITSEDFVKCVNRWDDKQTVFLFDAPWFRGYYDQTFSCFDRKDVKAYDQELIEICTHMKGKFIITSAQNNRIMKKSGFNNWYLKSEYVVSGNYPRQLITTNIKFTNPKILKVGLMLV